VLAVARCRAPGSNQVVPLLRAGLCVLAVQTA
jgi:hypothetical protein